MPQRELTFSFQNKLIISAVGKHMTWIVRLTAQIYQTNGFIRSMTDHGGIANYAHKACE